MSYNSNILAILSTKPIQSTSNEDLYDATVTEKIIFNILYYFIVIDKYFSFSVIKK